MARASHRLAGLMRSGFRGPAAPVALAMVLSLVHLTTAPPLWWDEGWTLSVARTWVQTGHYGRLLAGQPISPELSSAPTVALPVALSFRLFGIGAWQGRLPGVFWIGLALWLLYRLGTELYDRRTAVAALVLGLMTATLADLQPILLGKQVLAEVPGMCFLIAGYLLFFKGLRRGHGGATLSAGVVWGLGVLTKIQFMPFLVLSIGVTCVMMWRWRNRRELLQSAVALVLAGALPLAWRLFAARQWPTLGPEWSIADLLRITAVVLGLPARITAVTVFLTGGVPSAVALTYAARHDLGARHLPRLAVWVFASSMTIWYLLLSAPWPRYLFPAVFLSSIFLANLLGTVTGGFDAATVGSMVRGLHLSYWRRLTRAQRWTMILLLPAVCMSVVVLLSTWRQSDDSLFRLAEYLRTSVPPDAVIETYDAEILFVADQPVHFPPDRVHVQVQRRGLFQDGSVVINYDPLAAEPGYLVLGHFSRIWQVYPDDWLARHFRLEREFGQYALYRYESAASP